MRTILVTGKTGQVGRELVRCLEPLGRIITTGRQELDLASPDSIRSGVRRHAPDIIVNAAAYTAVDKAESEPDLAMQINAAALGVLAEEAKRANALFVRGHSPARPAAPYGCRGIRNAGMGRLVQS